MQPVCRQCERDYAANRPERLRAAVEKRAADSALDRVARAEQRERERKRREDERRFVEEVREMRSRQAHLDKVGTDLPPPVVPRRERASGLRELTAVALASDWHVEEGVDPAQVAGRNEFNLLVAAERVERFFQAIRWNVEHQRASGHLKIRDLVLWLGGDLMSGYIHEELIEGNALSPTQTIRWLQPRIEGGIRFLAKELQLESVVVPCSYGNHGRTTAKPRVSTGFKNSFEWLMYHSLADQFRGDKRVRFHVTDGAHQYVQVYAHDPLHFHHGDDVRFQGGVGGIAVPLLKAAAQWQTVRRSSVHCIGHWHQQRDFRTAVVNGSLIGFGPYSFRVRADYEPPMQTLFFVDRDRGKCLHTDLWVGEKEGKLGRGK